MSTDPAQLRDAADVHVFPPAIPLVTIMLGIGLDYLIPIDAGFEPGPARYWAGALLMAVAIFGLGWGARAELRPRKRAERESVETND